MSLKPHTHTPLPSVYHWPCSGLYMEMEGQTRRPRLSLKPLAHVSCDSRGGGSARRGLREAGAPRGGGSADSFGFVAAETSPDRRTWLHAVRLCPGRNLGWCVGSTRLVLWGASSSVAHVLQLHVRHR